MNKRDAYKSGVGSGLEAARNGDFTEAELATFDAFAAACRGILENQRQYAGHPTEAFRGVRNEDGLLGAFERGEAVGVRIGWYERQRQSK